MSIKVAIVEDNAEILRALSDIVSYSKNFELVGSFASGEEALAGLLALNPDIVLMDINLGGVTGIDCVKLLKPNMPKTGFIMCTVYEDDESVFEALKAGANGYVIKKTQPQKLLDAIKELAEGGAPMSSQIAKKVVTHFYNRTKQKPLEELSPRENEILQWLARGLLYKEISIELNISQETVRKHVYRIYDKLHVNNRTEAVNRLYGRSN